MLHNYLISGGKRFLNQQVASRRSCVFLFPLPSPKTYFSALQSAAALRSFCLQTVHYLQKTRAASQSATPRLGACALSGFSEGGRPLANVISSSPTGTPVPGARAQELLLSRGLSRGADAIWNLHGELKSKAFVMSAAAASRVASGLRPHRCSMKANIDEVS